MELVPFKADHMKYLLDLAPAKFLTKNHADTFEFKNAHAFTGIEDGRVLICGGVFKYWKDRGECWAVIDQNARQHFLKMHHAALKVIDSANLCRVEATVERGFKEGVRWMRLLGFGLEAIMQKYNPDGSDMLLFAKIRGLNV